MIISNKRSQIKTADALSTFSRLRFAWGHLVRNLSTCALPAAEAPLRQTSKAPASLARNSQFAFETQPYRVYANLTAWRIRCEFSVLVCCYTSLVSLSVSHRGGRCGCLVIVFRNAPGFTQCTRGGFEVYRSFFFESINGGLDAAF